MLESADEVLAIVREEIDAWAAGRPDHAADLRRDIDRHAWKISNLVSVLADAPSSAIAQEIRRFDDEQSAAVAELASFVAEMPMLPTAKRCAPGSSPSLRR